MGIDAAAGRMEVRRRHELRGRGVARAVVLVLAAAIGLAGCGGGGTATASPSPERSVQASGSPRTTASSGPCSPRPCANASGWIVDASEVTFNASSGSTLIKPGSGNVFLTATVTFMNQSGQQEQASPTQFKVLDSKGDSYGVTPVLVRTCPLWAPTAVSPGQGFGPKCVGFELPADESMGLKLVWSPAGRGASYDMALG